MNLLHKVTIFGHSHLRQTPITTTARLDTKTVYWCTLCNNCMLTADLLEGKCSRDGGIVRNITGSPLANAWWEIVRPDKGL